MPRWLVIALLLVFIVHLLAFARLALVRREARYVVVTITFGLLVIAFGLRLAAPRVSVFGVALYWYPRVAAWITAVISVTMFVRRRLAR